MAEIQHLRLLFSAASDSSIWLSDWEATGTPEGGEGAFNWLLNRPASASTTNPGAEYSPGNAVDSNSASYWGSDTGDVSGAWLAVQLSGGGNVTIDSYRLRSSDPIFVDFHPTAWELQATADPAGLSGWVTLDAQSGQSFAAGVWNQYSGPFSLPASGAVQARLQGRHGLASPVSARVVSAQRMFSQKAIRRINAHHALRAGVLYRFTTGHTIWGQALTRLRVQARSVINARLAARHGLSTQAAARLYSSTRYRTTATTAARLRGRQRHPLQARMRGNTATREALTSRLRGRHRFTSTASRRMAAAHRIEATRLHSARLRAFHSMASAGRLLLDDAPVLQAGGQFMGVRSIDDLYHDEGSSVWVANITLQDLDAFAQLPLKTPVSLDYLGERWNLVVDGRELQQRGSVDEAATINAVSPAIQHSARYADAVTLRVETGTTAHQAVEDLLGEAVAWNLLDWPIPARRLAAEATAPLPLAKRILEAAGGVLESQPDGQLVARLSYPKSVPEYAQSQPDHVLTGSDHIYSVSETAEATQQATRVSVSDSAIADRHDAEWLPDDTDPFIGELRVYPWPWDPDLIAESTRNGITMTPLGIRTAEITETLEVRAGSATSQRPVDELLASAWQDRDLGPVSTEGQTVEVDDIDGWSLLQITYRTRYHAWRVQAATETSAQLLIRT